MTLSPTVEEHPVDKRPVLPSVEIAKESPTPKEPTRDQSAVSRPNHAQAPVMEQAIPPVPLPDPLQPKLVEKTPVHSSPLTLFSMEDPIDDSIVDDTTAAPVTTVAADDRSPRIEWVLAPEPQPQPQVQFQSQPQPQSQPQSAKPAVIQPKDQAPGAAKRSPASAASGGYLARPSNIYAEDPWNDKQPHPPAAEGSPVAKPEHNPIFKEPTPNTTAHDTPKDEDVSPDMQLVFRETDSTADEPGAHPTHSHSVPNSPVEEPAAQDDADDLKRRAAERINKLRNLSFNVNAVDPNNEFETVPAYIRRNLELYNTISNVENFYSNYEVKTDENNNTEISTINTFLDGKRPD